MSDLQPQPDPDETSSQPAAVPAKPRLFATQGCPPVETRFKPGQSGNPRGRPKDSKLIAALVEDELDRKVAITVNGQMRRLRKRQVVARRIVDSAIKGDAKAIATCVGLQAAAEARKSKAQERTATGGSPDDDEAVLRAFFKREVQRTRSETGGD